MNDDVIIEASPESIIPNNDLYNCLLNFSGLNKSGCYGISKLYPIFIFLLLIGINVNYIIFDCNLNPFDIAKAIYYLFFVFFFVYTRFCYNIIKHYKDLIKIIQCNQREKIVKLISNTSGYLSIFGLSFWIYGTCNMITNNPYFDHNVGDIFYILFVRLAYLYMYSHIICYIVNICFVFKIHKYQLDGFKKYLQTAKFTKSEFISNFRKIKNDIRYSENAIGTLLNLGIISSLFRFPLDMIEIIYDKNYTNILVFISNSFCFIFGILVAAKINDYNDCYVTKLYKNVYIRDNKDILEYYITFFHNNKIYFRIIKMAPNSTTISQIFLIIINVAGSLISGLLSKKK